MRPGGDGTVRGVLGGGAARRAGGVRPLGRGAGRGAAPREGGGPGAPGAAGHGAGEPLFPGAVAGYRFRGEGGLVGWVALGQHAGRWFYLVLHHPAEAADGVGPRVAHVLREWRREDDGAGL